MDFDFVPFKLNMFAVCCNQKQKKMVLVTAHLPELYYIYMHAVCQQLPLFIIKK